ncbi:HAMP domain-containing sensor histidine kinase [Leifsonia sp. 22587]|uniref:HAMP domain-containing sensor histidine kinase n=1 Tax=Leifsonia sp. 22587 TaxID=3453946 RepID=UPI003F8326D1
MTDAARTPPLPRARRWSASLAGRIMLGTVAVGVIAVVVTALLAVQVVQSVAESQARQQLKAQATALVAVRASGVRLGAARLAVLGDRFAVVDADGTLSGPARAAVPASAVRDLTRGRSVSGSTTLAGHDAVYVGIPAADGGGVVGVRKVADIAAADAELTRWLLLALAGGLVVAVVSGVLLARRLGRPLTRIAGSARALAAGGRGVPIRDESIAEIDDIAHALRGLDGALTVSEERQREFLLSVSHEIRTPLTAIRGYAEALADGMVAPDDRMRVGRTLAEESERLRRFLDDLLELARLEADDFRLDPQPVDPGSTVIAAVDAWQGAAGRVDVPLRAELAPGIPTVVTDGMRLRQVLDGLIENALRATPSGSPIVVSASPAPGGGVRLSVRDGGPGLSEQDAEVAFERGELRDRYREVRSVGTGLGLSIARRLVGRLGGTIGVGAAPEGGASFDVSLPSSNIPRAER